LSSPDQEASAALTGWEDSIGNSSRDLNGIPVDSGHIGVPQGSYIVLLLVRIELGLCNFGSHWHSLCPGKKGKIPGFFSKYPHFPVVQGGNTASPFVFYYPPEEQRASFSMPIDRLSGISFKDHPDFLLPLRKIDGGRIPDFGNITTKIVGEKKEHAAFLYHPARGSPGEIHEIRVKGC
jgi:hypothetical protein